MFVDSFTTPALVGEDEYAARPTITVAGPKTGLLELAVHGRWGARLGIDLCAAIRNSLAEQPPAIVVDLHDMGDPEAGSVPLWLAARRAAMVKRPSVRFALCVPTATLLDVRLRRLSARHLPMFATMPEARASLSAWTPTPGPRQR